MPRNSVRAQRLFDENLAWASRIARNVARKVPVSIAVDDLIQEAHAELWTQAQRYNPAHGVPFQGYAYRAVHGRVAMACRHRRWKEATCFDPLPRELVDSRQLPDEGMIDREDRARKFAAIYEGLAALSIGERTLVRLIYLDEADSDELARAFGAEAKKMLAASRRAVAKLKRHFER